MGVDGWEGPVDTVHVYSDSDCIMIASRHTSDLEGCSKVCDSTTNCNAVNWAESRHGSCITRACQGDAKLHPSGVEPPYLAYYTTAKSFEAENLANSEVKVEEMLSTTGVDGWEGPVDTVHVYSDSDCIMIASRHTSDLEGCFKVCDSTTNCNAVNWAESRHGSCITRACQGDAKLHPSGVEPPYLAYYTTAKNSAEDSVYIQV